MALICIQNEVSEDFEFFYLNDFRYGTTLRVPVYIGYYISVQYLATQMHFSISPHQIIWQPYP